MRPYSNKEQKIIQSLVNDDRNVFTVIDFIKQGWPSGQFEISTFQQVIRVHLDSKDQMDKAMSHLLDVKALIDYLEYRGYISSWDELPITDNTEICGDKEPNQQPYFLPDQSLAFAFLKLGNKKFKVSESLKLLVRRKFKSISYKRHTQLIRTLVTGFMVVALVGFLDIWMNYEMIEQGVKVNLTRLKSKNAEVLKNQELNQVIIDSLHFQSKQLIILTNQIARNTENTREIEYEVKQQNIRINQLRNRNLRLYNLSSKNYEILKKTDSLLNKLR